MYILRNGILIRTVDGATIPQDERNADYREYLVWAVGNTADVENADLTQERIDYLWTKGDRAARDAFDENSRMRGLIWMIDPGCPDWRRARLVEIQAWLDSVWQEYYIAKAKVQGGDLAADLPDFEPCPWKFADLLQE